MNSQNVRAITQFFLVLTFITGVGRLRAADQYTGTPGYRSVNMEEVNTLNTQLQEGTITSDEYAQRIATLSHTVSAVGNNAARRSRESGSAAAAHPLVSEFSSITTEASQGPIPSTAPVTSVYSRILTDLNIQIVDQRTNIPPNFLQNLQTVFDRIPVEQLEKLSRITIQNGVNLPTYDYASGQATAQDFDLFTDHLSPILQGVGQHVYWQNANILGDLSIAPSIWAIYYANYMVDSEGQLANWAQYADLTGARAWNSEHGLNPDEAVAHPEELQRFLSVAAMFATASTQVTRFYKNHTEQDYVRAFRTDKWLTIGKYSFALDGNIIIGYTTEDPFAPASDPVHLTSFRVWDKGVEVPRSVLDRIPLKS